GLEPEPITLPSGPVAEPESDSLNYLKGKAKAAQQSTKRGKAGAEGETFTDRAGRTFRYVVPKKLGDPADSGISVQVARGSNQIDFNIKQNGILSVEVNKK